LKYQPNATLKRSPRIKFAIFQVHHRFTVVSLRRALFEKLFKVGFFSHDFVSLLAFRAAGVFVVHSLRRFRRRKGALQLHFERQREEYYYEE
jgi:hypothetical protein